MLVLNILIKSTQTMYYFANISDLAVQQSGFVITLLLFFM